jgi:hypothetical protein
VACASPLLQSGLGTSLDPSVHSTDKPEWTSLAEPTRNIEFRDLVGGNAVLAPVVELGSCGRGMRRHLTRLLERTAVLEIRR